MCSKILIVEDEKNLREILKFLLNQEGYEVDMASNGYDGYDYLLKNIYDVVICDIKLPGKNGLELLEYKRTMELRADFIMITSYGSVESAVEAMKKGAEEYITKPFLNDDLVRKVKRIIKYKKIENQNIILRKELEKKYTFSGNIVGKSKRMEEIFELVKRISPYDSSVLIIGASGTGKELIAKSIHFNSRRSDKPFIPVNCGAIPEGLLESEFFGHAKGAFTGAQSNKKGLLEEAEGGTLFLDEISEMDINLQVKLLRALQEREIRMVGATNPKKIDVRIIASTNKNLDSEIRKGRFREDLYYRLNVVEIKIPRLYERKEDIHLLVEHFIKKYNKDFGKCIKGIDNKALEKLLNYNWPGNVRELEHVIQRAMVMCQEERIGVINLSNKIKLCTDQLKIHIPEKQLDLKETLKQSRKVIEQELIKRALKLTNNNRTETAKLLGISHRSLMYKINNYEI